MNEDEILDGSAEDQTGDNTEASYETHEMTIDYSQQLDSIKYDLDFCGSIGLILIFSVWVLIGVQLVDVFRRG